MKAERATIEDLQGIIASLPEFWGDRDTAALHQALFVHELGDTSLVIRDADGTVLAYLLGFVSPASVGYIHVVAVRRSHRGRGLARSLYASFETIARQRGAVELKAITSPGNRDSHAFHDALGFSTSEVGGYSASGEARSVFRLALR